MCLCVYSDTARHIINRIVYNMYIETFDVCVQILKFINRTKRFQTFARTTPYHYRMCSRISKRFKQITLPVECHTFDVMENELKFNTTAHSIASIAFSRKDYIYSLSRIV